VKLLIFHQERHCNNHGNTPTGTVFEKLKRFAINGIFKSPLNLSYKLIL
jgi:hypothetical protein